MDPQQHVKDRGVADYFAILGMGDVLELKSSQNKYQTIVNDDEDDNQNHHHQNDNHQLKDEEDTHREQEKKRKAMIEEEEEYKMFERFYREIVEVAILTVYLDSNGTYLGGSLGRTSISPNITQEREDCEKR